MTKNYSNVWLCELRSLLHIRKYSTVHYSCTASAFGGSQFQKIHLMVHIVQHPAGAFVVIREFQKWNGSTVKREYGNEERGDRTGPADCRSRCGHRVEFSGAHSFPHAFASEQSDASGSRARLPRRKRASRRRGPVGGGNAAGGAREGPATGPDWFHVIITYFMPKFFSAGPISEAALSLSPAERHWRTSRKPKPVVVSYETRVSRLHTDRYHMYWSSRNSAGEQIGRQFGAARENSLAASCLPQFH